MYKRCVASLNLPASSGSCTWRGQTRAGVGKTISCLTEPGNTTQYSAVQRSPPPAWKRHHLRAPLPAATSEHTWITGTMGWSGRRTGASPCPAGAPCRVQAAELPGHLLAGLTSSQACLSASWIPGYQQPAWIQKPATRHLLGGRGEEGPQERLLAAMEGHDAVAPSLPGTIQGLAWTSRTRNCLQRLEPPRGAEVVQGALLRGNRAPRHHQNLRPQRLLRIDARLRSLVPSASPGFPASASHQLRPLSPTTESRWRRQAATAASRCGDRTVRMEICAHNSTPRSQPNWKTCQCIKSTRTQHTRRVGPHADCGPSSTPQ